MKSLKKLNIALLIIPILIFSLGYVSLLSTSPERADSHLLFFIIGLILYLIFSAVDYHIYTYYWKYIYGVGLVLLIITFTLGEIRYGSARWIDLGFTTIQPSEFAKISLIITLAAIISEPAFRFQIKKSLIMAGISLLMISLVFLQPDLGTSLVLFSILFFILYYSGLNKTFFLLVFLIIGIFSAPIWSMLHDYQQRRILVFLNPSLDVLGSGYNVIQALIAVGSGGWTGKGFGHGTQAHLNFLPAYWTDFAFASFAEEWGFVGVFILISLFLSILLTLLIKAGKARDMFGSLLVIGVFAVFFLQFVVNVGMNLGVMPVTGIPLPFISYGGSSLLVSMILLGIVQSVIIYSHEQSYRIS